MSIKIGGIMSVTKSQYASKAQTRSQYDEGLRVFFLGIYKYMFLALLLTGIVSFAVASSPQLMQAIFGTPLAWVVILAPLGMAIFLGMRLMSMSLQAAQISFWIFAALMGLSLSTIFLAYTTVSIVKVFFITAATFGAMSLWGYTTKRDLTGIGSFLMMGLFGIIIASLINLFFRSSAMDFVVSVIGVFVFIGLTAYDTQNLKRVYFQLSGSGETISKVAIVGALSLYLDFINLFISLLRLMGERR